MVNKGKGATAFIHLCNGLSSCKRCLVIDDSHCVSLLKTMFYCLNSQSSCRQEPQCLKITQNCVSDIHLVVQTNTTLISVLQIVCILNVLLPSIFLITSPWILPFCPFLPPSERKLPSTLTKCLFATKH